MAILLYPEVFTQTTLTEYLPSAKISAGYRNQKIISQPPWHWGIHQLITEEKILYCHVISDIIEKRVKCSGTQKEKALKESFSCASNLSLSLTDKESLSRLRREQRDGDGKDIYNVRHYWCSVSMELSEYTNGRINWW